MPNEKITYALMKWLVRETRISSKQTLETVSQVKGIREIKGTRVEHGKQHIIVSELILTLSVGKTTTKKKKNKKKKIVI